MKKFLNNKLLMFWAVLEVLAKFRLVWQAIAGFVTIRNEFFDSVNKIQKTANTAGKKTGEVTKWKNKSINDFVVFLFKLTSMISVHATNTKNADLKNRFDYTEGELKNMRPGELLGISEEALEVIKANREALAILGLTVADEEALEEFIDNFETITMATRTTITGRKAAGTLLRPQFKDASFTLKEKLDGMMEQFRVTNPDFYLEYWNARNKIDYGIRHEEEEQQGQ